MDSFLRDSTVSVIVPSGSSESLSEILQQDGQLEERSTLYFDEHLRVVVALETAQCPEARLNAYLQHLELKVEAWAVSPDGEKRKSGSVSPTRDLIATESVTVLNDPVTLLKQREDSDDTVLVLHWELLVTLSKPRIRLLDPSIVFVPVATIIPPDTQDADDNYFEPFSVQEPNLLQPLANGRDFADAPFLPVSRLERVLPSRSKESPKVRLRHVASNAIRAYPAVMARLKYTRSNTYSPLPSMIASLDIEIIPFIDIQGSIKDITVSMSNGSVNCLMDEFLPMTCSSKDCITFLYALKASQQSAAPQPTTTLTSPTTNASIETLSISLHIDLSVSTLCTAKIVMDWSTNVDFSQALNPSFGAPSQPMQRTNRPAGLNFGTTHMHAPKSASNSSVIDSSLQPLSHPTRPNELVTISFLAPSEPAIVGKPFVWKVLVVNRSPNVAKLAIVPLPRLQRITTVQQHYAKKHAPRVSSISVAGNPLDKRLSTTIAKEHPTARRAGLESTERDNILAAKAIVDENILYALHHSPGAVPPETDIISLTAELRIGPLGLGQCHETEIKFVAFKAGAFTVDAIRVVDLVREAEFGVNAPGVVKDLREVPDVVVVESNE